MKKGLTLIELIIYIGIVAIVLVVIINLATSLIFAQSKSSNSAEVQQNVSFISQKLTGIIENATTVNGSPSNQLSITSGGHTFVFDLAGNVFQVSIDGSQPVPLSNSKVTVSPPPGGQIFTEIANGEATTINIHMNVGLTSDINVKQTLKTSILMRGK